MRSVEYNLIGVWPYDFEARQKNDFVSYFYATSRIVHFFDDARTNVDSMTWLQKMGGSESMRFNRSLLPL